jgi:glutamine synthetase
LVESLRGAIAKVEKAEAFEGHDAEKEARHYRDVLVPAIFETRRICDSLEKVMPADLYPMPTYAELLFSTRN